MFFAYVLLACLSDPDFEVREAAERQLVAMVDRSPWIYGPIVENWRSLCPECHRRASRVAVVYCRWKVASIAPREAPVWPICDAYPIACPVIPFGLEDVRDRSRWPVCHRDSGPPSWSGYRKTTACRVQDLIREGWSAERASDLVDRMWKLERRDRSDCGLAWSSGDPWKWHSP